jgi:hypothetical protein
MFSGANSKRETKRSIERRKEKVESGTPSERVTHRNVEAKGGGKQREMASKSHNPPELRPLIHNHPADTCVDRKES